MTMRALAPALLATAVIAGAAGAAPATPPTIGGCPVFPATSVWNQPVDRLPVAKDSATLIGSIGLDSPVHPDFGSGLYDGQKIGIPYVVVSGSSTPKAKPTFDYADESDPGPYPIPQNVPIEGDPNPGDGDRHALIVDRDTCTLYELYALHRSGSGWAAGSGAIWSLRSNKLRPLTLDLGRRGGPPHPPRPGPLRRGGRRSDRPRAPVHGSRDPARLHLSGATPGRRLDEPRAAADGPARAAEGELRHQRLPAGRRGSSSPRSSATG